MTHLSLTLINPLGMHARAASKLVDLTKTFEATILVKHNDKEVDAKSIMSLLMLGAPVGSQLEFVIEGEDEAVAAEQISALINAGFHELEDGLD